jgi:hypothetical protein
MYLLTATAVLFTYLFVLASEGSYSVSPMQPVVAERLGRIQQNYGKGYVAMDKAGCNTLVYSAIRVQNIEDFDVGGTLRGVGWQLVTVVAVQTTG